MIHQTRQPWNHPVHTAYGINQNKVYQVIWCNNQHTDPNHLVTPDRDIGCSVLGRRNKHQDWYLLPTPSEPHLMTRYWLSGVTVMDVSSQCRTVRFPVNRPVGGGISLVLFYWIVINCIQLTVSYYWPRINPCHTNIKSKTFIRLTLR